MKRFLVCAILVLVVSSFCSAAGTWQTLDYPGAVNTFITGISGSNIVGGCDGTVSSHGFLYNGTSWRSLEYPGGGLVVPRGIDGDKIVGALYVPPSPMCGFIYDYATDNWTILNYPRSYPVGAWGISGNNVLVQYGDTYTHSFIYDGTNYTNFAYPGALATWARGISGKSIIGYYDNYKPRQKGSFLYDGTKYAVLAYPGANDTEVWGIEGSNIVGYCFDISGNHSFLYDGASWTSLQYPGSIRTWAYGISGSKIVGVYWDQSANQHGFIYTMPEPMAEAGADKVVYTWIDKASVTLDGADSNDPNGRELTYKWKWIIDANVCEANGVSPVIELPVGVHTIQLVVNNGLTDSKPDDVNVTVIGALEGKLKITPQTINRKGNQPNIQAVIELPDNIVPGDVNMNGPLVLYPGEIKSTVQTISKRVKGISADFNKAALMDAVGPDGGTVLKVVGKLGSGQFFFATSK